MKSVVLLTLLGAAAFFVKTKKDMLVREGANFLQTLLSRESKLDVKIGRISGKLNGVIRFDDVRLEDPDLPAGLDVLFRARRLEFRYQLWDFVTKNFRSKIVVNVTDPVVSWRPSVRLRGDPFPFFAWMRDLLLTQRQRFAVHAKNLTLIAGLDRRTFPGITFDYENDRFELDVPVRHLDAFGNDLSTEVKFRGRLELATLKSEDRLIGQLYTEGSVVNWQPLPWESRVDFVLTRETLSVDAARFLGGFELTGVLNFADEAEGDLRLRAADYPIKNFEPFFGRGEAGAYDGTLNLEAVFRGPLDAMKTEANATIRGGHMGGGHYRAMTLHASGVYPTLQLSDSYLLMEDGVQMKFADKTVEFRELLSAHIFRELITQNAQENASLGDWGFKRPLGEDKTPEFLMERSLGQRARVQFRKYNEPEASRVLEPVTQEDKQDMEVGFTYHLRAEDTLKYTVREDEQFVGIERKMSF